MTASPDRIDGYDAVTLVLAIVLIGAPWIVGYAGDRAATLASCAAGVALLACAVVALTEFTRLFEEVDVALGLLTALAPWLVGFSHDRPAMIAHVAIGGAVALISAGELWWLRKSPPHAGA